MIADRYVLDGLREQQRDFLQRTVDTDVSIAVAATEPGEHGQNRQADPQDVPGRCGPTRAPTRYAATCRTCRMKWPARGRLSVTDALPGHEVR
jgi:hypothetical protein